MRLRATERAARSPLFKRSGDSPLSTREAGPKESNARCAQARPRIRRRNQHQPSNGRAGSVLALQGGHHHRHGSSVRCAKQIRISQPERPEPFEQTLGGRMKAEVHACRERGRSE